MMTISQRLIGRIDRIPRRTGVSLAGNQTVGMRLNWVKDLHWVKDLRPNLV